MFLVADRLPQQNVLCPLSSMVHACSPMRLSEFVGEFGAMSLLQGLPTGLLSEALHPKLSKENLTTGGEVRNSKMLCVTFPK